MFWRTHLRFCPTTRDLACNSMTMVSCHPSVNGSVRWPTCFAFAWCGHALSCRENAESFGHVVLTARRMAACTTCARPEDPGSENDPGAHVSSGATESGLKSRTPLRRCPRPTSWLSIGVGCAVACSVRPGGCSCAVAGSPKAGPVRLAATASSITSLVRRRPFEPDSHGNPRTDQRQKVPPAHDAGETATPCPLPGSGARSPITAALSSVPPPSIFRTTAPASKRASWIRL